MSLKQDCKLVVLMLTAFFLGLAPPVSAWASSIVSPAGSFDPDAVPRSELLDSQPKSGLDIVRRWNSIAIDAGAIDHARYLEQEGPTRTSRALAIVQIAVFDAVNAIVGGYQSYTDLEPARPGASFEAAVAQAAHDTLVALYPSQETRFDRWLAEDLRGIPQKARARGVELGQEAAAEILALREDDGSQIPDPPAEGFESDRPGKWRRDPVSMNPIALGAYWGKVEPFVMRSGRQFRLPPPPALTSEAYADAFKEVKLLGGVGWPITPTSRTLPQTLVGVYWSYDGTPYVGTPPREYNQIIVRIADKKGTEAAPLARLLALANVAMADAAIAAWDSKYYYRFWRPVSGIRAADEDGNRQTSKDPNYTPLGAQASNLPNTPDFTPPFPSYPSGHATLGAAMAQVLRDFYDTDRVSIGHVSAELNGKTLDFAPPFPPALPVEPPSDTGRVRPLIPRSYASISEIEWENARSRIFLGVHWSFDATNGITLGEQVGDYVLQNAFLPEDEH
ncbi:phosphatase PAP2 family protein [Methylomagnum sp.]